jgi:hypothetical protein
VLEFDDDIAAKRLMVECPDHPYKNALVVVRGRHKLHEKLHPAFLTWLNGGVPEFEYEGSTLEGLKK